MELEGIQALGQALMVATMPLAVEMAAGLDITIQVPHAQAATAGFLAEAEAQEGQEAEVALAQAVREAVAKLGFGPTDEWINAKKPSRTIRVSCRQGRLPAVRYGWLYHMD